MDADRNRGSSLSWFMAVVVLVWWIFAFWFLLRSTTAGPLLGKFLRPGYWWLVEVGTAILVLFLIAVFFSDDFSTGRRGFGLLVQMGIMIIPVLYLPTAIGSQLSPEAANKRSFFAARSRSMNADRRGRITPASPANAAVSPLSTDGENSGAVGTSSSNRQADSRPRNGGARQAMTNRSNGSTETGTKDRKGTAFLDLATDSEPYEGKRVTVEGMVGLNAKLPRGTFFCYRLAMFCCAADASPVGILVKHDKSGALKKGAWVKVEGVVGSAVVLKQPVTEITADKVESTQPPKQPYLFP